MAAGAISPKDHRNDIDQQQRPHMCEGDAEPDNPQSWLIDTSPTYAGDKPCTPTSIMHPNHPSVSSAQPPCSNPEADISPCIFTTFAYQRACRNRLPLKKVGPGGILDIERYIPCFVYDVLQLPGSLANVFDSPASGDILKRMSPGRIQGCFIKPGYKGEPEFCLGSQNDYALGMVAFGRGKRNRRMLDQHYGACFKMTAVRVEFELSDGMVATSPAYTWIRTREDESAISGDRLHRF